MKTYHKLLKELYKIIHPDLYQHHPKAKQLNAQALQLLNQKSFNEPIQLVFYTPKLDIVQYTLGAEKPMESLWVSSLCRLLDRLGVAVDPKDRPKVKPNPVYFKDIYRSTIDLKPRLVFYHPKLDPTQQRQAATQLAQLSLRVPVLVGFHYQEKRGILVIPWDFQMADGLAYIAQHEHRVWRELTS